MFIKILTSNKSEYLYVNYKTPLFVPSGNKYKPSVLQNESHPCLHEKDLRDYCRINGIIFQVSALVHTVCPAQILVGSWPWYSTSALETAVFFYLD